MNECPECKQGKCINCNGLAWDDEKDDVGVCTCYKENPSAHIALSV